MVEEIKEDKFMKLLIGITGLGLIGAIFALDYVTNYEICFSIFYLLPIAVITWRLGLAAGISVSLLSAVAWLVADLNSGFYHSHFLVPYWNAGVRLGFFLAFVIALGLLKRALQREEVMSRLDYLTGLSNFKHFCEIADYEINRMKRGPVKPLTLAFIDIDDFKAVNDRLGHQAGNDLLRSLGASLSENLRATDTAARIGGDEFLILLPETGESGAAEIMARLQRIITDDARLHEQPVTFSIGLVTFVEPPESVDELIARADEMMYEVKNHGKDNLCHRVLGADSSLRAAS